MDEQREAVRAMQDYIREHINEDINIADLAEVSAFSPWYARKLFIKHVGMTPAVYVRRLKLSKSALRLRDENLSVLDVAMDMGFGSVDGYQRAFRREFGCNPKEYSSSPVPIWLFLAAASASCASCCWMSYSFARSRANAFSLFCSWDFSV